LLIGANANPSPMRSRPLLLAQADEHRHGQRVLIRERIKRGYSRDHEERNQDSVDSHLRLNERRRLDGSSRCHSKRQFASEIVLLADGSDLFHLKNGEGEMQSTMSVKNVLLGTPASERRPLLIGGLLAIPWFHPTWPSASIVNARRRQSTSDPVLPDRASRSSKSQPSWLDSSGSESVDDKWRKPNRRTAQFG
jgi:hypothetical protein